MARLVDTSTTSVSEFALVPTDRAVRVTEALPPRPRVVSDAAIGYDPVHDVAAQVDRS